MRRTVTLPVGDYKNLAFMVYHDEDVRIDVNGVPAAAVLLKPGTAVTLCVHVHQTIGGQGIDLGLASSTPL